jgi:hypothetical protein
MFRRWLIRGLALVLLALCVLAWAGSYGRALGFENIQYNLGMANGRLGAYRDMLSGTSPWHSYARKIDPNDDDSGWDSQAQFHVAGFTLRLDQDHNYGGFTVPLWFLVVLSALMLWSVWRKTRAKPLRGGFPVEVAATERGEGVGVG